MTRCVVYLLRIFVMFYGLMNNPVYKSVHCVVGLLDVQNILSANTVLCACKLKVINSVIT
jgi:hypothetical protein